MLIEHIDLEVYFPTLAESFQLELERESYDWFYVAVQANSVVAIRSEHAIEILVIL